MAKERVVIIGADAAGMSAAGQARKLLPGAEITAYERSRHCSSPPAESYYAAGLVESNRS